MVIIPKGLDEIQTVTSGIALYGGITFLCFGFIGNAWNILVFTTLRLFRKNPSALCILIESMANFGQICIALLSQILFSGFGINGVTNSPAWCKLRNVSQQFFNLVFMGAICLAAFDQYLSTNPRWQLRQISSLQLTRRLTIGLIIATVLHGTPFLVFFDLQPSQGCIVKNWIWSMYYRFFYYPVLIGFLPMLISTIFGSIAFYHVRHLIRRGVSTVRRRLDRQFTAMIFVRVFSFVILTLPYVVERIVTLNINYYQMTPSATAIARLISMIITLLFSANYAVRQLVVVLLKHSITTCSFR